jgi:putative copper export protein
MVLFAFRVSQTHLLRAVQVRISRSKDLRARLRESVTWLAMVGIICVGFLVIAPRIQESMQIKGVTHSWALSLQQELLDSRHT